MPFVTRRTARSTAQRPRRFTAGVVVACLASAFVAVAGTAPARAAADTTAPNWGTVSVSPTSIDTSAAPATVTVTARITDDQSGIVANSAGTGGYGGSGSLTFRASSGNQNVSANFTAGNRISGTAQDGVYRVAVTLPHYAAQGTWTISSASLSDSAGNNRYLYSAADLTAAGLTASFSQTGAGDTTAPSFAGLTFTPTSVDTSGAARSVTARLHVTDDLAGLETTTGSTFGGSASISLRGPSGSQNLSFYVAAYQRISGTARDGIYETTVTVPRFSAPGTWAVSSASVQDSAGNSRFVQTAADLSASGLSATFSQTGAGDTTAPTMSAVSVTPTAVNPAVSAQGVTVRVHITDDLAGLTGSGSATSGYASVSFTNNGSPTSSYASASFSAQNRVSGTETDGIYEATMMVPRGATGHFTVSGASASDAAGNYRFTNGSELGSASFDIVDTVAVPSAPTHVTATAGNGQLTVAWTAPARDGGAALTGYRVTASTVHGMLGSDPSAPMPVTGGTNNGSDATVTTDPSASSVTVTGLTNGASYTVTVWAANSVGWGPASDPSPTVKPFDPASDTSPPVLSSLDVSPTSLDTSAAPATVTITARIVDDLAGLAPYYPSSSVSLRSPSGHQSLYWSFNESNRISGNALDGTYRAVLTLPQYSETGTWTLSANLSDALGNTASLTTKALADAGLPSSVTQSGTVADVTGPVLAGLTFSPSSLDTSGDAQVVTVTAHLTDDLSGLSSYRPSIWLRSPSGRQGASVSLAMESGTGRDGLWTGTATIPRYSDAGTWTTAGIYLSDAIGNSTSYGTADLTAAGFPTGFTQTGTADTTAPTLAGLTIAPASVDTSASPQSVVVSAHVTDDLAGLPQTGYGLSVVFRSPSGHQTIGTYSSTRLSGSAVDGVWQQTITVPRDAEHGRWTVSGVSVTDALSNSRTFSSDDLAAAGLATSFDQTGAGDSAPPAVRSLTFTPGAIDTSAGTKVVTIQARLTDDRSGVSSAWLQIMPPSGRQTSYVQLTRTSGDSRDGVYEGRLTVGRYAEAGTWRVSTLTMSDLVQNWASLTASDLRAAGLSSSFEQTGTADTVAPQLAALTWTPGTVDTAAAARTVTVRGRFTDDLSGLPAGYGPYVTLKSPSGRQMTGTSFNRVSGTGRDATYEAALTVNRYSEAGAWTVSDLSVTDNAQNTRHLTGAELTAAGFTAGFTQTGAADTAAPVLVAVSAAPARIDTSAAAANVTVTAHITDDKSGMGMYTGTVTFTSPSGAQSVKGYFGMPASGTGLDGTYQVNLGVPRYAEPGTWTLSAAELTDLVGNQVKLGAADLAAAGISASFEQIGTTGDRQAPVLADFSVNPGAVNVATSVQRVTVRAHVTDDLSGVSGYSVAATFTSPSGQATLTVPFGDSTRTSGTARDGAYEATLLVPYRSEAGTWSAKVTVTDGAGNATVLDGAALTRLGFPSTLDVRAEVEKTAPAAPWGVTASSGNGAATVAWTAPADDGGSPVTGYTVTARTGGTTARTVTVGAAATTAEIGGLTNGAIYTFTVTADNAIGTSPESAVSNATTPATVPGTPTGVAATAAAGAATVGWSAPASDGGNPVASYRVDVRSGGTSVKTVTVAAPATTADVAGLTNGTAYTFTVTALNALGAGPESDASAPVTPLAVPGTPTGVSATAGNASATVSWTAPTDNGGSPVATYTVTALAGGAVAKTVTVDAPASSAVVGGLTNGTAYRFTVAATNAAGSGPASTQSAAVTPVTTPDAPANVTATAGNGSAVVRWSAPAGNGGSAVTGYTVSAFDGTTVAKTVTAGKSATSVTVGGLHNGVTYRFTVAASNAAGAGTASDPSADVTPTATPTSTSTTTTTSSTSTSSTSTTSTSTTSTSTTSTTTTTTAPSSTTTTTPTTTTTTTHPSPGLVKAQARSGYWMVSAEGRVYAFGDATHHGEPRGQLGDAQAVDLEPTGSGNGYWILDDTGRVFAYGDAKGLGNVDRSRLAAGERATSLSRTPSGAGYWIFTSRGRVLTFGDAVSHGDVSALTLAGPVLDSIATPSGNGYYMVASDGGIFAFGDAKFHGSMGGRKLNAPVQSLVPDSDGEGYWLVASDGGIFAFDAPFRGSMGGRPLNRPVSGMVPFGNGYLMVGEDGGIFNFSDRAFSGSLGATPPARPVVAVAVLEG